jgi:hypothetical protein
VNEKNVEWHYIASDKPQQIAFIASFAGKLARRVAERGMVRQLG